MKKTFKVLMLPTEKAIILHKGQLWTHNNGSKTKLHVWTSSNQEVTPHELQGYCIPQHLYILSDDEIKEGDWKYNFLLNKIEKHEGFNEGGNCKKIVATTDKSLFLPEINFKEWDGSNRQLPQLPESFIQAYIKAYNEGNPITEVDLEMGYTIDKSMGHFHQERNYFIKTRPDNTVIVHQSKMYSKDEVNQLFIEFVKCFDVDADSKDIEEWKQDNLS